METIEFNPLVDTEQLAKIYANVFAGPPWNENTRCLDCEQFFGLDTQIGQTCINGCGNLLIEAYPLAETKEYIAEETSELKAVTRLIKNRNKIIAFIWGFVYQNPEAFAKKKYKTPKMQNIITDTLRGNGINDSFFYFSECGVQSDYRGQGLSNLLFQDLEYQRRTLSLPAMLRTNMDSPMIAVSIKFGLRQVFGSQVLVDQINKRLITTGQLINGIDQENQARTLFVSMGSTRKDR